MSGTPLVRPRVRYVIAALALVAGAAMTWHHFGQLTTGGISNTELIYAGAFLWLLLLNVVPYFHRDLFPPAGVDWQGYVGRLYVVVVVPAHNEDPGLFLAHLDSLAAQTRLPQRIHVVENGYPQRKLEGAFNGWRATRCPAGVEAVYSHNLEPSKREAQAIAFRAAPQADIIATIDSDMVLDPGCIANGIAPFARRQVMSVCGTIVGQNIAFTRDVGEPAPADRAEPLLRKLGRKARNAEARILPRLVEPGFVGSFLGGRASFSMMGTVDVNGGALSFYRASVVRKYLHHYLTHTIAGRKFSYGDDAMMTRYCLLEGETLFQSSAWGYTLHPEHLKHLTKQRVRWWRSFFWGNVWLLRTFPPDRAIWWLTAWKFTSFAWYTVLIPAIVWHAVTVGSFPVGFVGWLLVIGAFSQMRYLSIRRPGESFWSQLLTVALSPLGSLLNLYLGWVLQYVGLFTCLKTGWGTRQQVEVGLGGAAATDDAVTVVLPRISDDTVRLPRVSDDTVRLPRVDDDTVVLAAVR